MTPRVACLSLVLALGCGAARQPLPHEPTPGVVIPHSVAEGKGEGSELPPPSGAAGAPPTSSMSAPPPGASASSAAATPPGEPGATPDAAPGAASGPPGVAAPPDPEALRSADQIEYTFVYADGDVSLKSSRRVRFKQPIVTARKMGRYAVELWVGRELVERVRFDFPMLASDEPKEGGKRKPLYEPPAITKGPVDAIVLVPVTERARRAALLDRATGREIALEWPPAPPGGPAAPATSPSAAPASAPPAK